MLFRFSGSKILPQPFNLEIFRGDGDLDKFSLKAWCQREQDFLRLRYW